MIKAVLLALSLVATPPAELGTAEKTAQQNALAAAIAEFARTPDEVAFLVSWGAHETHFSLRIHAGNCKRWECDRGRARGPWQAHRGGMPDETWARMYGVENTWVQTERAARHARWALRQCPDDRVRGAFRVLGGLPCYRPLRGEDDRVATFQRVRARL